MKNILFPFLFCATLGLAAQTAEPTKNTLPNDSVLCEYVRVTYLWAKFNAYYEDGKVEDLKTVLHLDAHGIITDQKLTDIFFKISGYFRKKGFCLVTTSGVYAPSSASNDNSYCEYIYKKEILSKK